MRLFAAFLVAVILLMIPASPVNAQDSETLWQLRFEYAPGLLVLAEATPIAPTVKRVTQPGMADAAVRYDAVLEWLDYSGEVLTTTPVTLPFGTRTVLTADEPCESFISDDGVVVIRVPGPASDVEPAAVRLQRDATKSAGPDLAFVPDVFRSADVVLDVLSIGSPAAKDGPVDAEKIQDSGPDSNRLVVVVCGDGYTTQELQAGAFDEDAQNLLDAFHGRAPWDVYFDHTNIYQVNTVSNQSGSDNEDNAQGPQKDTYYHSMFFSFGIERLLTITNTGSSRAIQAADDLVGAGAWDYIFMLVNSEKYGGSGGPISVSSIHSQANEVILHEFGHTFAGLADEYDSPIPNSFPQDPEPNVDQDSSLSLLKWSHWVVPGTPLPTPATSQYDGIVGAFEGARYFSTGIFRPWRNCLMRNLGQDFCPVCSEEHTISYFDHVRLIDSSTHTEGVHILVPPGGVTIGVTPVALPQLTYRWRLNGSPIDGETASAISLAASDVPGGTNVLTVDITHDTPLVRKTTITDSRSWTVQANASVDNDSCSNAIPIFLDDPFDGSSTGASGNIAVCGVDDKKDVWHSFTSPINGVVRFTTCLGANFNTTVSVYDECSGTLIACNDDFCGEASEVEIPVVLGEDYLVRIAGVGDTTGDYTILAEEVMSESCCRDGDVNGDGELTPADALLVFEFFTQKVQLDLCAQYHADVRNSQDPPQVTPNDAQCIFLFFLGEPGPCDGLFPQPCSG